MFQPNPLFTDGAVLCRRKEIAVFGDAPSGARVSCALTGIDGTLLGEAAGTAVDGRFLLYLPPQEARMGCTLTLHCGDETFTALDVSVGEVWLAGGQSNMELPLMNADGGPEEVAAHDDPQLRFFDVPRWARPCPEADEAFAGTRWQKALPGQAAWVSAVAYWFAKKARAHLNVPVGIIDCWWGGTSITCWLSRETLETTAAGRKYLDEYAEKSAGITMEAYLAAEKTFMADLDAWNGRVAEAKRALGADAPWAAVEARAGACPWNPPAGPGSQYRPHCLYDNMLRRVMPAGLNGFLWYQGEEDASRTDRYDLLMAQLIAEWRSAFGDGALPFLFVQLPGWGGDGDPYAWPRLRLQQDAVRKAIRGTGMAVTIDLGDRENIHPTDKQPVGERLFELARGVAWGEAGETGPEALGIDHLPGALRVRLSAPLTWWGPGAKGFELRGRGGDWYPAEAVVEGSAVLLTSPAVPEPFHARYAFLGWPEVDLRGGNGLPLAPFMI